MAPGGTCPYGAWTKMPANVQFRNDRQIAFINDSFVHLGAAGLDLGDGSQSDLVEGCVFTDISGSGLELGGVDQPLAPVAEFTSDNRILNNHIYNIGAEFRGGIGIVLGYARNTAIRHNQLDHLPYAGISIGWGGWPDKIQKPGIDNNLQGNAIADNLIYDYMLVLADGGAIYTQGLTGKSLADGERVTGNVVRNQFGTGHGIYTDNGSCNITVDGNLIFHTNFDNWGSRHKDYYNGQRGQVFDPLLIENNYWEQGDPDNSRPDVTEAGNLLISNVNQAPVSLIENAGIMPKYRSILAEAFADESAPEPPSRVSAAPGKGAAYVTWNPPVFEGSSPVREYGVTASNGAHVTISAAEFAARAYVKVPGLAAGQEYTFTVRAKNASGSSGPSLPSWPVRIGDAPSSKPAAPARVQALAGHGMASIHFQSPPAESGERKTTILGYVATINPGDRKVLFEGRRAIVLEGRHTTFYVIDGLQSGQTYTFSVAALTPSGVGAAATTAPVKVE